MSCEDPVEVELKLIAPDAAALHALPAALHEVFDEVCAQTPVEYRDTYLDTDNWTLFRAGFGCRIRERPDGALLTLKSLDPIRKGWASRLEMEEWLEGPTPVFPCPFPGRKLKKIFGPVTDTALLQVKVELGKCQQKYRLATAGGLRAEAISDKVEVFGSSGAGEFFEMELELEAGDEKLFRGLAETVRWRLGLQSGDNSKYERGLALVGATPPEPPGDDMLRIRDSDRLVEVAHRVLHKHFGRFQWHEPGARLGLDPEHLHDMRVASRRMLTALRLFKRALTERRVKGFCRDLKWVARALGWVRDLDIAIQRLGDEAEALDRENPDSLTRYRDHLLAERERARKEMLRTLSTMRFARFNARMERFLALGPPLRSCAPSANQPAGVAVPVLIWSQLKKLLKEGRTLANDSPAQTLHAFRRRCKSVRYTCEFFIGLYGAPVQKVARRIAALQQALGKHHDALVANQNVRDFARGRGSRRGVPTEFLLALGRLVEMRERAAEKSRGKFFKAWSKLDKAKSLKPLKRALKEPKQASRE